MEFMSGGQARLARTTPAAQIRPIDAGQQFFAGHLPVCDELDIRTQLCRNRTTAAMELISEGRGDIETTRDCGLSADDLACSLEWCLVHEQNDSTATVILQALLTAPIDSCANNGLLSHAISGLR